MPRTTAAAAAESERHTISNTSSEATYDALLAGGVGGACLCIVGAPFDIIKVQQQQTGRSAVAVAKAIVRVEGLRGLWRGVTPPLLVAVPQFAIVFGAFEASRALVQRQTSRPEGDLRDIAIAGALVAIPTSFIYTPVDRVKLALQADGLRVASGRSPQYEGVIDCVRGLVRSGGAHSLSRGFWATLARDVPAWAVYFSAYAAAKASLSSSDAVLNGRSELCALPSLVAGGLAGAATWAVCIPADVVKTVYQSNLQHTTYAAACRGILRSSGIGGFVAGFWTIVAGGVPRDAACFTGTEVARRALVMWREPDMSGEKK